MGDGVVLQQVLITLQTRQLLLFVKKKIIHLSYHFVPPQ
jgi:hypothetical protein